jgi:Holliday junction resolvase RusA-like endonuclease
VKINIKHRKVDGAKRGPTLGDHTGRDYDMEWAGVIGANLLHSKTPLLALKRTHHINIPIAPKSVQHGSRAKLIGPWNNKKIHWYTDEEKQAYVSAIQAEIQHLAPKEPWLGLLTLELDFYMERTEELNKHFMPDERIPAYGFGGTDWDNFVKGTQDAMLKAGFWHNDSQIFGTPGCYKWYCERDGIARIEVTIRCYEPHPAIKRKTDKLKLAKHETTHQSE